jgi:hypothetical protein
MQMIAADGDLSVNVDSLIGSFLAAGTVMVVPYLLYRLARWARSRPTGAYVLGAALSPVIAAGSVVDPDSRVVSEAKQIKMREEDDAGDPPNDQ